MKNLFVFIILIFSIVQGYSQLRSCGSALNFTQMQQQNPAQYQRFQNLETFTRNYINNQGGSTYKLVDPNGLITIPVVVHVLHNGESIGNGKNISDAQIQSQIDVLNEDFRRLNADRVNTPSSFASVASDYNFQFSLACQDIDGNQTNGIRRVQTTQTQFSNSNEGAKFTSLGGDNAWDANTYLNLWVCDLGASLFGYSSFPADLSTNPNLDGVVINYKAFGRIGTLFPQYNLGRTATHEIGHWFNLRHIWGDATCGDDLVDDTPTQQTANYGCPLFPHKTCGNTTNGDMFMNYMDYSDDNCYNTFTNGQKLRGRAIFASGGPRAVMPDNDFKIISPNGNLLCSDGLVKLFNPNCLTPTWTITSGNANIIGGQSTNSCVVSTTGNGTFTIKAIAGNYSSEVTINNFNNPISISSTVTGCTGSFQNWTLRVNDPINTSNWYWYVGTLNNNSQINIYSPYSQNTTLGVKGGGVVKINYTDACGASRTDGITV